MTNKLEQIYHETPSATSYTRAYLDHLKNLMDRQEEAPIAAFIDLLLKAREKGSRIFFIGNGGSAATASHFANDLSIGTKSSKKPFRVISLADNTAVITAIANDISYESIFVEQLKSQMAANDVVVAISASGNSPNIIKAIDYANSQGATTVGLTGFDGGQLKKICKIAVHTQTQKGEYGPVEDAHMIINHIVGSFLMFVCHSERVS